MIDDVSFTMMNRSSGSAGFSERILTSGMIVCELCDLAIAGWLVRALCVAQRPAPMAARSNAC